MGISAAVFQTAGRRTEHFVPGAYSRSAAVGGEGGGVSANNGVILGRSQGGQPRKLMRFSSVQEARDTLVSGELLEAVAHAFNPAPGFAPQSVSAMVVNGNTQGRLAVKAGGADALIVKSAGWGTAANSVTMRLSKCKKPGELRLDFAFGELAQTIGGIKTAALRVKQGARGEAALNVEAGGVAVAFANGGAGGKGDKAHKPGAAGLFISWEQAPTVADLAAALTAAGLEAAAEGGAGAEPSRDLDRADGYAANAEGAVLTRGLAAVAGALEACEWAGPGNVEKPEGAPQAMPDTDASPVFFAGAEGGAYAAADWAGALSALETENVQIISTPSASAEVHTLISNHCAAMSSVANRRERTALLGGAAGETVDAAVGRAAALDSSLVSYCYPGITALSPLSGEAQHLSAAFFACKLLGLECSVAVNEPLTWKTASVLGFSRKLKTAELETLIAGGVLCGGETDDGRLAVIRAMTTHQGSQLQLCERSMVREDLYMNRDFRRIMSRRVGRPAGSGAHPLDVLQNAARSWAAAGLITPNDAGENVWGAALVTRGDAQYISFHRNLAAPQNFFFITAYNHVYSSAAEIAA